MVVHVHSWVLVESRRSQERQGPTHCGSNGHGLSLGGCVGGGPAGAREFGGASHWWGVDPKGRDLDQGEGIHFHNMRNAEP